MPAFILILTRSLSLAASPAHEIDPLDQFVNTTKALADPLRVMVLRVLSSDSFAVLELCAILNIAQPAMSHHLKILLNAQLVNKRREGNNLFYRRALAGDDALKRQLFMTLDTLPLDCAISLRIAMVHAGHQNQSRAFFEAQGPEFQGNTAICPAHAYVDAVIDLLGQADWRDARALEVGPGAGELLGQLATRFGQVVAVDHAASRLQPARALARGSANISLQVEDVTDLGKRPTFNFIVAAMVLHHQASPGRFFEQTQPLLLPGGRLVIVELCPHDQHWVREACGDLWLGFEPEQLSHWAQAAGLKRSTETQFLAQKNGFQLQIHAFIKE